MPTGPTPAARRGDDAPLDALALREVGLFGALSDEVLERLARALATVRVDPGDTVFREGDVAGREMYVVLEGEMDVSKRSSRGKDVRVAVLGPGDWFGEMSLIDMQARSATVRALAPSRLARLRSEDLEVIYRSDLKSYALIVLNMARGLSRRLRVTDGVLADSIASTRAERALRRGG